MIKLLHGDCLKLMFDLPDNSVDCVICDMPFGTTACHWDSVLPLDMLWHHYRRICKDNAAIVLNASQPFTTALINSNEKMYRHQWVWNKKKAGNIFLAKSQPMKIHEDILVFGKSKVNYYPQMTKREKIKKSKNYGTGASMGGLGTPEEKVYTYTHKNPVTIIDSSNAAQKGKVHPTQKPVALIEYLIKTYTNEGDTVLDNCMGSGTTGVACQNLNRNFIGIELDDKYFQIAKNRIEATEARELETA